MPRVRTRTYVEDFGRIDLLDVRRSLGGARRLKDNDCCMVELPDGAAVQVDLVRQPHGFGTSTFLSCCRCNRSCRVLHITGLLERLVCLACLKNTFSAKFRSQVPLSKRDLVPV